MILWLGQTNTTAARRIRTALRRSAWMHVFEQMDFRKWLDTKQTEELYKTLNAIAPCPLPQNIKGPSNIFRQRKRLFEIGMECVPRAHTTLQGQHHRNIGEGTASPAGRATTRTKVNCRFVFPYGCRFWIGRFDLWSARDAGEIYSDLDRVLAVLGMDNH